MDITVTNISSAPVTIGDIYKTLAPAEAVTFSRAASDLPTMRSLQDALAAGTVTMTVTPTADEVASGLLSAPQSIQAADMQPVAASDLLSPEIVLRASFAAGGGGSPDDVVVYALNALPFKCRVLGARAVVTTAVGSATAAVRTQAAGAGSLVATMDFGTTGAKAAPTGAFTETVLTPGSTVGLFIRRSDSGIAGQVHILLRRET